MIPITFIADFNLINSKAPLTGATTLSGLSNPLASLFKYIHIPALLWLTLSTLGLSSQVIAAQHQDIKTVISCKFGLTQSASILRGHRIANTYVYYLQNQDVRVMLFDANEDASRGETVIANCLGNKERILVVSGEFPSNYIRGLVLRFNQQTKQWDRIEFAERARPTRVYLSSTQMSVVIPNHGHETNKKYLIYTYMSSTGRSIEGVASDSLPPTIGQTVINLSK